MLSCFAKRELEHREWSLNNVARVWWHHNWKNIRVTSRIRSPISLSLSFCMSVSFSFSVCLSLSVPLSLFLSLFQCYVYVLCKLFPVSRFFVLPLSIFHFWPLSVSLNSIFFSLSFLLCLLIYPLHISSAFSVSHQCIFFSDSHLSRLFSPSLLSFLPLLVLFSPSFISFSSFICFSPLPLLFFLIAL